MVETVYFGLAFDMIGMIANMRGQKDALMGTTKMAIHTDTALGKDKPSKFSN